MIDKDNIAKAFFGVTLTESHINSKCVSCKGVTEFRDELSKKEYGISGLCQSCQDDVFGVLLEDSDG